MNERSLNRVIRVCGKRSRYSFVDSEPCRESYFRRPFFGLSCAVFLAVFFSPPTNLAPVECCLGRICTSLFRKTKLMFFSALFWIFIWCWNFILKSSQTTLKKGAEKLPTIEHFFFFGLVAIYVN